MLIYAKVVNNLLLYYFTLLDTLSSESRVKGGKETKLHLGLPAAISARLAALSLLLCLRQVRTWFNMFFVSFVGWAEQVGSHYGSGFWN